MVAGGDCATLYVYDEVSGILRLNLTTQEPPYTYTAVPLSVSGNHTKVTLDYGQSRLFVNAPFSGDSFSILEINLDSLQIVRKYPDYLSENYYGLSSSERHLYLIQQAKKGFDLYVWDPFALSFEGLYTVLSFPSRIQVS